MESKRIYQINKKRFILTVMLHFETVKNFCTVAKISRTRFYALLTKKYATKRPEGFVRLFDILNDSLNDGKYDYELFWRSSYE